MPPVLIKCPETGMAVNEEGCIRRTVTCDGFTAGRCGASDTTFFIVSSREKGHT